MSDIAIHPIQLSDAPALLDFELKNRAYFERCITARDPHFYHLDAVYQSIADALSQRSNGTAYSYLVKQGETIVGRVNFTAVERRYYYKATLGYRIGEAYTGKGVASKAVALGLIEVFERFGLWRVEAQVRSSNIGSCRVLERNGFNVYGRANQSMHLHGEWHDIIHYERRAPTGLPNIG